MKVTVYTRSGCHLCEQAEAVVRRVATGRAEIELVDIDADPALADRYTVRVPVVVVDGREIAEYEVDEAALRRALAPTGDAASSDEAPPRRGGTMARMLRWFALWVVAAALLVGLTTASVALITPDVFVDVCERPELVPPAPCAPASPAATPQS